ncbi:helix-turn-helix domain-containing protein [Gordonia sp. NPDC003424]
MNARPHSIHPETDAPRHYFTSTQAAESLGVAEWTIRRYARDGVLRAYRVGLSDRGQLRFRRHDLDAQLVPLSKESRV